jgi:SNF2 family DNA or RNA helicase
MTALLNVIEDYLAWRKWKYCRIDGSTNIDERQKQMDVFNAEKTGAADGSRNDSDDRHFVFLLSTRAGGLGINLVSNNVLQLYLAASSCRNLLYHQSFSDRIIIYLGYR